ncbi:hypothetical protein WCT88_06575 [Pectobacterium carotovorum]|uniref:hypothetical protein n=1 Tax=Pectobacterium carotovorum TaxID=554 RepID=UPI002550403B|nr:hypothetical protein [Pectobacterium carotovorum]MDK9422124.1 hypothetical protein [Pectobacterium carotovorum]
MSSNRYKIIMVCVPYHLLNVSDIFLNFLLCKCKICPEKYFPIYFLINKNKVERISPNQSNLFDLLNKKTSEEEKIEYDKKITKCELEIKNANRKKEVEADNYQLISQRDDDREYIEEINKYLVEFIIKHIKNPNVFNEQKEIESYLNTQETQPSQKKLNN